MKVLNKDEFRIIAGKACCDVVAVYYEQEGVLPTVEEVTSWMPSYYSLIFTESELSEIVTTGIWMNSYHQISMF